MKNYINGRFSGTFDTSKQINFWHIFRWKVLEAPKRLMSNDHFTPLEVVDQSEMLLQKNDFICWLSHASFLIQLGGKRIIIDPVLDNIPFYRRQVDFPYSLKTLGKIDYLLISHTHYDHFDTPSIKSIISAYDPKPIIPLHMSTLIHKIAPHTKTDELDWYERYVDGDLSITLVPAMHWGRRRIFDTNRVLWGGYIIQYKNKTIYFAGDTANGPHFTQIGEKYNIDIALLPIGAYKPEYIMKANHLNPIEAYCAYEQLQAKLMIPMHYGTFKLTDEPLDEPLQWIQNISTQSSKPIKILKVGEVLSL